VNDVFETHFHLYPDDDLPAILARATDAGVSRLLVAGTKAETMAWLVEKTAEFAGLYAAVGIHPHDAASFDGDLAPYRNWLQQPHIPAVGEIGMDYHYDYGPRDDQVRTFEAFLSLAQETQKPSIVHCREAEQDCFDRMKEILQGQRFVVHCYTGNREWAYRFLDIGGYLSFTGIITFKRSQELRDLVADLPADRIFFETDSPYLAPIPHRGKRNEPAYVPLVVACAAEARGVSPEDLNEQATANALRFFGIDPAAAVAG